jgi:RES domain-containing protein
MQTLWRISNYAELGGWGGKRFSSRWTSLGHRVVYMAESPAGAMLEILAHLEFEEGEPPDQYQLTGISVEDGLVIRELELPLWPDWREHPEFTQRIGDAWLVSLDTPLAKVPSAIIPRTWNYLLNPEHPDAKRVTVAEVIEERFDNRLFRFGAC